MKSMWFRWSWPRVPAWAVVTTAGVVGLAALGAEVLWPRDAIGPPLEEQTGFYAGAGFAAALVVVAGAWAARILRDDAQDGPRSGA
ncbi:MAG: hypothetical protein NW200_11725 [Hyphomonadaceae bacterium]|nr:hypothetical protein [Hyphomonadaceae bacterium]